MYVRETAGTVYPFYNKPLPKNRVIVHKKLDGAIVILWKNKPLKIKEFIPKKEVNKPFHSAA